MPKISKILVFFALGGLFGCSRPAKPKVYYIDRIQLAEGTLQGNPALSMTVEELGREVDAALDRSKRFVRLAPSSKPRPSDLRALRCRAEIVFARETLDEGGVHTQAEVGALLDMRRPGEAERYQARGLGRASFSSSDAPARVPAFRKALLEALDEVVRTDALHLDADDKRDAELIADLSSADPRVRTFAVQVLADRKNAAAVPGLIERLKDPDREVAMRAVGALGALGDVRAVPALIDMAQTRDPEFLMALIDVVAAIGGKDAEAFLFTLASGHPEDAVRHAAEEAQARLVSADAGKARGLSPKRSE